MFIFRQQSFQFCIPPPWKLDYPYCHNTHALWTRTLREVEFTILLTVHIIQLLRFWHVIWSLPKYIWTNQNCKFVNKQKWYFFDILDLSWPSIKHKGMNTRGWLLWKRPHVLRLICVFCHNFWTNYDLDMFSISKWLSKLQFCERY